MDTNQNDVVLDVSHVWKIYCRNLKRAMWYGMRDLGRELVGQGQDRHANKLRPSEFLAVKDADFQVKQGECVAMIGPNGAGKSTMLKMVNGLVRPDSGTIKIRGKVGALIELGTGFNPILSGKENIYVNAAVLGLKKREVDRIIDDIIDFAELGHVINDPVKTYSSGMRVRLGFSVAANLRPNLLIMDEVLAVGDVGFRMKCFAHLRNLTKQGVSIILVTHAVAMLQRIASRAIVFGRGKIVFDGDLQTGCTVYEEMMNYKPEGKAQKIETVEQGAWIDDVQVVNDRGESQAEFETGESMNVRTVIKSTEAIRGMRLIVALASPVHGVIASMATPYQQLQINLTPGETTINLRFDRLPLLLGAYSFNISLYGPETTDFYQRRSMQGAFRVVGPAIDVDGRGISGIIKIEHAWKIQ